MINQDRNQKSAAGTNSSTASVKNSSGTNSMDKNASQRDDNFGNRAQGVDPKAPRTDRDANQRSNQDTQLDQKQKNRSSAKQTTGSQSNSQSNSQKRS